MAGVCTLPASLTQSVFTFLFKKAGDLSRKVAHLEGTLEELKGGKGDKEESLSPDSQAQEQAIIREVVDARAEKLHLENTTLVLLSRKIEGAEDPKKATRSLDMKALLKQSQAAKFHKVELYLHKSLGNHDAVIDSYLNDREMQSHVFDYIHNLFDDARQDSLSVPSNVENAQAQMKQFQSLLRLVLQRMNRLVEINAMRSAILVFTWFPKNYELVFKSLQTYRPLQFIFIRTLVKYLDIIEQESLMGPSTKRKVGDDEEVAS